MADKITGHGHPSNHLKGEVGQYYEDLDTGDLYECRSASEYSKLNGRPFGGYIWELRAKGEDIREIYGAGGSGGGAFYVYATGPSGKILTTFSGDYMSPAGEQITKEEFLNSFKTGVVRISYDTFLASGIEKAEIGTVVGYYLTLGTFYIRYIMTGDNVTSGPVIFNV